MAPLLAELHSPFVDKDCILTEAEDAQDFSGTDQTAPLVHRLSEAINGATLDKKDRRSYKGVEDASKRFYQDLQSLLALHEGDERLSRLLDTFQYHRFRFLIYFIHLGDSQALEEVRSQADSRNNPYAQSALGEVYLMGVGVGEDKQRAFHLFEQAALQGNAEGQYHLARCYEEGHGTEKNESQALSWLECSARQGYRNSQYSLGLHFFRREDHDQALKWFNVAADHGHSESLNYLLHYKEKHRLTYIFDATAEAVSGYEQEAESGYDQAQFDLGYYYHTFTKERDKAFYWFKKAGYQGHASAQHFLGEYYLEGNGLDKDEEKAFRWYQRSAKQGLGSAMEMMVHCYQNGVGVRKDPEKQRAWETKLLLHLAT